MQIEIWSDVACPWCYIGKRRFEAALASFPHRDDVEVAWRSFELNPETPPGFEGGVIDYLSQVKGIAPAQAATMLKRVADVAAGEDLELNFDDVRHGNTIGAHQLIHLAADHGLAGDMKERLLRAYFTEGVPVHDRATLVRLATDVGLDGAETQTALDEDRYLAAVHADETQARVLGITGVPFFVIDRKYGISGAQETAVFTQALDQAWAEANPLTPIGSPDAISCEGDACAV